MKENETAIIYTPKYLGFGESTQVKDDFKALCELGLKKIIIDMNFTVFITGIGLGVLVRSLKQSQSLGIELVLWNVNPLVMSVLSMSKLNEVFTIETETFSSHQEIFDCSST